MMITESKVVFNVLKNGLYYHDTVDHAIILISTVLDNRKVFTCREYKGVKATHRALGLLGYPSERYFTNMVSSVMITNCPITTYNIKKIRRSLGLTFPP